MFWSSSVEKPLRQWLTDSKEEDAKREGDRDQRQREKHEQLGGIGPGEPCRPRSKC